LALEALAHHRFDLVLMDMMPVMDGLEATRRFRASEQGSHPGVGDRQCLPGDRDSCIAAGMDDYISSLSKQPSY
jgi:CheY-like chemotaxis protein